MDHCDPVRYCKEFNLKSFDAHPAHKWLNKLVDKDTGDAVDLFRYFHPDAKSMYTCWNTLINARPSNYGTRIDYVICTRKLTDCFSDCVLLTDVFGSDHCPVLATMHPDWLSRIDSIASSITAADDSSSSYQPPALCSSNQRDLSGPSKTIKDFFKPIAKPASVVPSKTTSAKPSVVDPHETDKYQQKSAADNPKRKIPDEFLTEQQLQARRFWQSSKLLAGKNGDNIGSNFIPPPPCCHHKEPAKLLTVNKSGPNKGRKFFMCARPVGAASSVIDVASGDTDESNHRVAAVINEFRCDFFQWKDKK
jgi:AP endonuclease-2